MRLLARCLLLVVFAGLAISTSAPAATHPALPLADGWSLQTSALVKGSGEEISSPQYRPQGWHAATVPTTVVSALVKNGVYPDPYYGKNLRSIPGTSYPIGENFSNLPMPSDSPFNVPWWFRTEFQVPAEYADKAVSLHFDGINYRANIWLNGKKIADAREVAGAFRRYEFDVTATVLPGKANVLAVEIFAPTERDLAITFVDWNPQPPDKNMGLWRRVYLSTSGPVTVRHPFVESRIDFSSPVAAHLTVVADLKNHSQQNVKGTMRARIGEILM
ncbi:MAG: glycosyl hydrolase 2 galactose-binding domain-containing protein [Terriglobales bacterium]